MLQIESFAGPPGWVLCEHFVVPCVPPYRLDLTVAVLRRTSLNPVDVLDAHGRYLRAFAGRQGLRVCVAHQPPDTNTLHVALYVPDDERKAPNEELRVHIPQMLGTGVNLSGFYTVAAKVPELALLVLQARGVKPPHYPSLWEALCNAVVFQQVSLRVGHRDDATGDRPSQRATRVRRYPALPIPPACVDPGDRPGGATLAWFERR